MVNGDVYRTKKNGDLVVEDYQGCMRVKVRFVDTGFVKFSEAAKIRNGNVFDPTRPSVFGVGYIGDGGYNSGKDSDIYSVWHGMMCRCYNPNNKFYKTYGGMGCVVDAEWHNFQNFAEWYERNRPEIADKIKHDLDKDIKFEGNKVYSKETCLIVTKKENIIKRFAKTWSFINPEGVEKSIYNLKAFCTENSLTYSKMKMLHKGDIKSYKGWKSGC